MRAQVITLRVVTYYVLDLSCVAFRSHTIDHP